MTLPLPTTPAETKIRLAMTETSTALCRAIEFMEEPETTRLRLQMERLEDELWAEIERQAATFVRCPHCGGEGTAHYTSLRWTETCHKCAGAGWIAPALAGRS